MSETTRVRKKCGASLYWGGGFFFICELQEDHAGRHSEDGKKHDKYPYFIMWEGDMRETCQVCSGKIEAYYTCRNCQQAICKACWSFLGTNNWEDIYCVKCRPEETVSAT